MDTRSKTDMWKEEPDTNSPCNKCAEGTILFNGRRYCVKCEYEEMMDAIDRNERLLDRITSARRESEVLRSTLDHTTKLKATEENAQAYETARCAMNNKKNLYLHGKIGCGKSHLARTFLSATINLFGHCCAEVTGVAFGRMAARFEPGEEFAGLFDTPLILIDDVDKMPMTPAAIGALWEILDNRYELKLQTIVTANVSPAELVATVGNDHLVAALDRLKPVEVIELTGASLRGKEINR